MSGDDAQAWHRDVVEAAPVPVAVYDSDGVVQYVNPAAVEFVNADAAADVVGRPAAEFVHPDDRGAISERITRVLGDREPVPPVEATFVATDGEQKHAVTAGAPVTYEDGPAGQAVLNDVTDRKRRERQLRRERDRFELLFENLPSAVVYGVARGDEPIVKRVNDRFEDVFGHDREEIEGDNLDEYIVPEDRRDDASQLNRKILSEGRVQTDVERETPDGLREFLLTIALDGPDEETPEGYAIYTDITEKKRTERRLQRQNERLEEFASMVAHDLRNPLSVASAAAELARETGDDRQFNRLIDAHERMDRIIDDLLTLAKQGGATRAQEPVALAAVAADAWDTVAAPDADLTVRDDPVIAADRGRLREILENVFRNAAEHAGPDVAVDVGRFEGGFYVADDGPGIPPERRELVFESGYTTGDDGTGFGLTIVQRLAAAHGWSVAVTESADGGARFEFSGIEDPS